MTESVCRFIDTRTAPDIIQTINFVYECKLAEKTDRISAVYRINCVASGDGVLKVGGVEKRLKKGDIFFIFPASTYSITGSDDFKYMYVSFMGLRANILLERYGINKSNFIFEGGDLVDFWLKTITLPAHVSDISSEAVVLYSLSVIATKINKDTLSPQQDKFLLVKKYVDDNFSDPELDVVSIAKAFSYNPKYLSGAFKKRFKVGISSYITMVRINHACALMEKNYTGVGDVAYLCGYNDTLYFSKVFKLHTGVSPREYIKALHS